MSEQRRSAQTASGRAGGLSRRSFLERLMIVGGLVGTGVGSGLLAACSPAAPPSPTSGAAKPAEAAKPGEPAKAAAPAVGKSAPAGSIVLAMGEEPRTMASWHSYSGPGYPVLRNVEEALLNRDPKTNQLVGELATKWDRPDDTTWRFTLRQGVKFHDGSPFNAEAAAFAVNYTWDKANAFEIRAFIGPEMTAKPVDDYTLDVVTAAPDPILPARLYFSPLVSMKLLKETPDQYPIKPVGTGPYRFVEWVKGQHVKLEANPDWWGNAAADAQGAATIKNITFVPRGEPEVRTAMVKTGEADFARWVSSGQCQDAPVCASGPAVETVFMRLDTQHPALADVRVREAIGLAIDKKTILNSLIGGGTPAGMLVGPSALGYNPALQPIPYEPDRAKQLIAEAKAAGVPIDTPVTVMGRANYVMKINEVAETVAAQLKAAGLPNVKISIPEQAIFQDLFAQKPIPPERGMIAIHMHGNELMDYAATVSSYYASSGKNCTLDDPEVDEMHRKALPLTGAEREKAYQAIAERVAKNKNIIPIGQPNFFYAVSSRLQWQSRMDGFIMLKEMSLKA